MEDKKRLVQVAGRVLESLTRLRHSRYLELMRRLTTSVGQLQELAAESRKMGISITRGWFSAADRCCSRTSRLLIDTSYSLSQVKQFAESPQMKTPTLSLLVAELDQVQDEFGSVDFDKGEDAISVVTDPITLDGTPLGPFKIQLGLNKLGALYKERPYNVIALNPNPASTDEGVTHPHVSGEKLCEGDGAAAITASLEQGRLSDFFTMIRSILNTYNPESPYVALRDWDGVSCYDCGYTVTSEDTYFCEYCDHDYCHECSTYCRQCEETVCLGCAGQCPHCEEPRCKDCIGKCTKCEELCCEDCLEEGICPTCKEEMENDKTYAELSFNVGPGGQVLIPVEIDYGQGFGPSNQELWDAEYAANVEATEWLRELPCDKEKTVRNELSDYALPYDFITEFGRMEPAERQFILDELAERSELWEEGSEVMFL